MLARCDAIRLGRSCLSPNQQSRRSGASLATVSRVYSSRDCSRSIRTAQASTDDEPGRSSCGWWDGRAAAFVSEIHSRADVGQRASSIQLTRSGDLVLSPVPPSAEKETRLDRSSVGSLSGGGWARSPAEVPALEECIFIYDRRYEGARGSGAVVIRLRRHLLAKECWMSQEIAQCLLPVVIAALVVRICRSRIAHP